MLKGGRFWGISSTPRLIIVGFFAGFFAKTKLVSALGNAQRFAKY